LKLAGFSVFASAGPSAFAFKAPGDWRTPKRFALSMRHQTAHERFGVGRISAALGVKELVFVRAKFSS
jgi:hypothetical protein